MAKKLLAILLAVAMVFSLGVTAFAADGEVKEPVLVPEPEQMEDVIFISAKSEWVKPGRTVSVPVSIISNIEPEATPDVYFFAIRLELTDITYADITGFTFNEGLAGFDKFTYVVNSLSADDGSLTIAFVVKAEDTVDLLHQERLELGTVEVAVGDDFPGGETEIQLLPSAIRISNAHEDDGFGDEYSLGRKSIGFSYMDIDEEIYNFANEENLYCVAAHCVQKMPWQDKIVMILENWAHTILRFFTTIFTVIDGLF